MALAIQHPSTYTPVAFQLSRILPDNLIITRAQGQPSALTPPQTGQRTTAPVSTSAAMHRVRFRAGSTAVPSHPIRPVHAKPHACTNTQHLQSTSSHNTKLHASGTYTSKRARTIATRTHAHMHLSCAHRPTCSSMAYPRCSSPSGHLRHHHNRLRLSLLPVCLPTFHVAAERKGTRVLAPACIHSMHAQPHCGDNQASLAALQHPQDRAAQAILLHTGQGGRAVGRRVVHSDVTHVTWARSLSHVDINTGTQHAPRHARARHTTLVAVRTGCHSGGCPPDPAAESESHDVAAPAVLCEAFARRLARSSRPPWRHRHEPALPAAALIASGQSVCASASR